MQTRTIEELIEDPQVCKEIASFLKHKGHPSIFEDYGRFRLLLLRRIQVIRKKMIFSNETFFFLDDQVYFYDRNQKHFLLLKDSIKDLNEILSGFYSENQKILDAYSEEIEKLEDYLFERKVPRFFMDLWFGLKKDMTRLETYFFKNEMVYREFLKRVNLSFGDFIDDFRDIEEHIKIQAKLVTSFKSRLDGLYNYQQSIKADGMNKTIVLLTVISGIFLPLNLIVGFFGINTSGLFFTESPDGTKKVLIILGSVFLISILGLRTIKLIDTYLLRFVLGRYNFYKNLSNRLDEVDKKLHGQI